MAIGTKAFPWKGDRIWHKGARDRARCGLSIVEMLIALAISAILLTATMVAIDASFQAYASTAAQASTQAATRLVCHRFMSMIRTSTAHGPLEPDASSNPPVILEGDTITSHYMELVDSRNNLVRVEYRAADQELWATNTPLPDGAEVSQPLLSGVTNCQFFAKRRLSDGIWVLERFTIDLSVQPPADATLAIETAAAQPIRMVGSTMPRKLQ